jgi:DNA helicase HerA-like ATPase
LEELIEKAYPIVIFDPHNDYVGLQDIFADKVTIFIPNLNIAEESRDTIISYVQGLSGQRLSDPQEALLDNLLQIFDDQGLLDRIHNLRNQHGGSTIPFDLAVRHFHAIMGIAQALNFGIRRDTDAWENIVHVAQQSNISLESRSSTYGALIRLLNNAGKQLNTMMKANRAAQTKAKPLPSGDSIANIVSKGKVAIISLEGYSDEIKQTFVGKILQELLDHRINGAISRFLSVIEEAHIFIPSRSEASDGIVPSIPIIRRIATEGRKYGAGLIMISQRPSRIDSTILSQANSYIILKLINPSDQKYVKDVVESIVEEDAQLLPDLAIGEALITGQCVRFPILAHISQPRSKGKYEEEDFIKEFVS